MELIFVSEYSISDIDKWFYMRIQYSGIERRRSQRAPFTIEVWYKDRNKSLQGFKHAYGKNISQHGLLLETYESFPECTILELKFHFSPLQINQQNKEESCVVIGEVVRSKEIRRPWLYHVGISFCKIEQEVQDFLKDYITNTLEHIPLPSDSDLYSVSN